MMNLLATATTVVNAPAARVWEALVDPNAIKQYMFGTNVTTDWEEGGPITWKGEWQGRGYEDKGIVLQVQPSQTLQYTHYSPLSNLPDTPENYHTVTIDLSAEGHGTRVVLTQDHNTNERAREHSQKHWEEMLAGLREYVESQGRLRS
jgi:uncharacterized protein YndB with AHSA1/START domain